MVGEGRNCFAWPLLDNISHRAVLSLLHQTFYCQFVVEVVLGKSTFATYNPWFHWFILSYLRPDVASQRGSVRRAHRARHVWPGRTTQTRHFILTVQGKAWTEWDNARERERLNVIFYFFESIWERGRERDLERSRKKVRNIPVSEHI